MPIIDVVSTTLAFEMLKKIFTPEGFSRLLGQANPKQVAIQRALERALTEFQALDPELATLFSLTHENFLKDKNVITELLAFLTLSENPDPARLTSLWQAYLDESHRGFDLAVATEILLALIEKDLKREPSLQEHFGRRGVEQLLQAHARAKVELQAGKQTIIELDPAYAIESIEDALVRAEVGRAVNQLNIESVDTGLSLLATILEHELRLFLIEANAAGIVKVTKRELDKFVTMIECMERHNLVDNVYELHVLRFYRNDKAHKPTYGSAERARLLRYAPFYGDKFIKYIALFRNQRGRLQEAAERS